MFAWQGLPGPLLLLLFLALIRQLSILPGAGAAPSGSGTAGDAAVLGCTNILGGDGHRDGSQLGACPGAKQWQCMVWQVTPRPLAHLTLHRAPWGFSSATEWKSFAGSGLILLLPRLHSPFHCSHLLLLKLDKYFLSPAVSPFCSSWPTSCNKQNICNN